MRKWTNESFDWIRAHDLQEVIHRAHDIGGTFSCESADDLRAVADEIMSWRFIGPRSTALLRYYAERIDCENGAATSVDHAVAKALLALDDGGTFEAAIAAITAAIEAYNPENES
jgi:hypothetical protein